MKVVTGGNACEVRHGGAIECIVGETVVAEQTMAYVDGAPEEDVTIDGTSIVVSTPGRRRFRTADGMFDLVICCAEQAAVERLPDGARTGHGVANRRMILRALAREAEWFNGLASDLDGRWLAPFGAPHAP
jgi:hypothetical protein